MTDDNSDALDVEADVPDPTRLRVALVGRPNVGKSTLFNRLTGSKKALVHDTPGLTRDWQESEAEYAGVPFLLLDTPGLDEAKETGHLANRLTQQALQAAEQADALLFLVDGAGLTPLDQHFADAVRRLERPVVLLVNKCESQKKQEELYEAYSLGLGEPVPISAQHGLGLEALIPFLDQWSANLVGSGTSSERPDVTVSVIGRPNAGKSTLVNRLIGENRLLTGEEVGLTRDAVAVSLRYEDKSIRLIDTAGLRKQAKVSEHLERMAVAETRHAIRFCQVALLMIDATRGLEKQDLAILNYTAEEGRAVVLVLNKWDQVKDPEAVLKETKRRLGLSAPLVKGLPVVPISATEQEAFPEIWQAVFELLSLWRARISTAQLNNWLSYKQQSHPAPLAKGRRVKIRYMTQIKSAPPTFALFVSQKDALPDSYVNFLANGLRQDFGLTAVPLRLIKRQGKNPYAKE